MKTIERVQIALSLVNAAEALQKLEDAKEDASMEDDEDEDGDDEDEEDEDEACCMAATELLAAHPDAIVIDIHQVVDGSWAATCHEFPGLVVREKTPNAATNLMAAIIDEILDSQGTLSAVAKITPSERREMERRAKKNVHKGKKVFLSVSKVTKGRKGGWKAKAIFTRKSGAGTKTKEGKPRKFSQNIRIGGKNKPTFRVSGGKLMIKHKTKDGQTLTYQFGNAKSKQKAIEEMASKVKVHNNARAKKHAGISDAETEDYDKSKKKTEVMQSQGFGNTEARRHKMLLKHRWDLYPEGDESGEISRKEYRKAFGESPPKQAPEFKNPSGMSKEGRLKTALMNHRWDLHPLGDDSGEINRKAFRRATGMDPEVYAHEQRKQADAQRAQQQPAQ